LVAWLFRNDQHHDWARGHFERLRPPLLTCEPVIAEACYLVELHHGDPAAVLELVQRGVLEVAFNAEDEAASLISLMRRYRNLPMSLADACLVRMTETRSRATVFTTDSDFRIYRRYGRQVIPTLMPTGVLH
jgi:predicted nucleic acid-binding protein